MPMYTTCTRNTHELLAFQWKIKVKKQNPGQKIINERLLLCGFVRLLSVWLNKLNN